MELNKNIIGNLLSINIWSTKDSTTQKLKNFSTPKSSFAHKREKK